MALGVLDRLARRGSCACALVFAGLPAHPATLLCQHGDTTKTIFTRRDAVLTGGALVGTAILTRFDV